MTRLSKVPGGWTGLAIIIGMAILGFIATTWLIETFA